MANTNGPGFDPKTVAEHMGSTYPEPFRSQVAGRAKRRLGDAFGLTQFGVNLATLPPGCLASMRHWHSHEDEFLYVVEGELVLATDAGEQILKPGMVAGFPAGKADGHHLINRNDKPAVYLEVGGRDPNDVCEYPDIDMRAEPFNGGSRYVHKDGKPY
ncbi:MAG: cupin domain-containing protein [Alphaproteobacteria bacterium]